ncbi:MAG: NAD(P)H-dependent oxidoreductase [Myxococcales bacterium]|nr:NAD(P)H-dependent oxidoreductase [Myxococcales bacterium]
MGNRQRQNFTAHAAAVVNSALARAGVDIQVLHGADLDLSFPGDGASNDSNTLERAVAGADAVVLATPEYHGTYSAFMKLVIESLGYPSALRGKPVAMLGVAGGRLGATKSLEQLRNTCAHTGALVLPGAVSVAHAKEAFLETGECVLGEVKQSLEGLADTVLNFLHQYVQPRHVLENMIAAGIDVPWSPDRS